MDHLRFYVLFHSISVISKQCEGENEWLCTMARSGRIRVTYMVLRSSPIALKGIPHACGGSYLLQQDKSFWRNIQLKEIDYLNTENRKREFLLSKDQPDEFRTYGTDSSSEQSQSRHCSILTVFTFIAHQSTNCSR